MNIPTIIALIAIGAFVIFVIGCVIYRNLLAKIDIYFQDKVYSYDEQVTGIVTIYAKKSIKIESVSIALTCRNTSESNNANPGNNIAYEDTIEHKEQFLLKRSNKRTFDFSMRLPKTHTNQGLSYTVNLPDVMLPLIKHIGDYHISRHVWNIEVVVNTDKIQIPAGKKISVKGYL